VALIGADDEGRRVCAKLAFELRARGVRVDVDLRGRKVGALVGHAAKAGTRFTLTVGSSEIAAGAGGLKRMADGVVQQVALQAEALLGAMEKT
jgi:histidyl-tRNA synthetase